MTGLEELGFLSTDAVAHGHSSPQSICRDMKSATADHKVDGCYRVMTCEQAHLRAWSWDGRYWGDS